MCPGQGSQTPGFLAPWLEVPDVAERLRWLSAVAGIDLVTHGTTSDADTIRDTAVAQPLIVAAGLVALPAVLPDTLREPEDAAAVADVVAGHSVGELTAAAYLDTGRSVEAAARQLFVHPNTVRYRLRGVAKLTGWDPSHPREGFVLQVAIAAGRLADAPRTHSFVDSSNRPREGS